MADYGEATPFVLLRSGRRSPGPRFRPFPRATTRAGALSSCGSAPSVDEASIALAQVSRAREGDGERAEDDRVVTEGGDHERRWVERKQFSSRSHSSARGADSIATERPSAEHDQLGIEHRRHRRHGAREVLGLDAHRGRAPGLPPEPTRIPAWRTHNVRIPRRRAFATIASAEATLSSEPRPSFARFVTPRARPPRAGGIRFHQPRRALPDGVARSTTIPIPMPLPTEMKTNSALPFPSSVRLFAERSEVDVVLDGERRPEPVTAAHRALWSRSPSGEVRGEGASHRSARSTTPGPPITV